MQVCDMPLAITAAGGSDAAERAPPPPAKGAEGGQTQDDDGELGSRPIPLSCYLSAWAISGAGPLPEHASCAACCRAPSDKGLIPFHSSSACGSGTAAQAAACTSCIAVLIQAHHTSGSVCAFQVPFVLHGPLRLTAGAPVKKRTARKKGDQAAWSPLASSKPPLAQGAEKLGQLQPQSAGEQPEAEQPQAESRARGRGSGRSRGRGRGGRSKAAAGKGRQGCGATAEPLKARAAEAEPQPAISHRARRNTAVQAAEADRAGVGEPAVADAAAEQEPAGDEGMLPAKVGAMQ